MLELRRVPPLGKFELSGVYSSEIAPIRPNIEPPSGEHVPWRSQATVSILASLSAQKIRIRAIERNEN
jgi:hypothetical protein